MDYLQNKNSEREKARFFTSSVFKNLSLNRIKPNLELYINANKSKLYAKHNQEVSQMICT